MEVYEIGGPDHFDEETKANETDYTLWVAVDKGLKVTLCEGADKGVIVKSLNNITEKDAGIDIHVTTRKDSVINAVGKDVYTDWYCEECGKEENSRLLWEVFNEGRPTCNCRDRSDAMILSIIYQ